MKKLSIRLNHEDGRQKYKKNFSFRDYPVYHQKGSCGKISIRFSTSICFMKYTNCEMKAENFKIMLQVCKYREGGELIDVIPLKEIKVEDPNLSIKMFWSGIHEFKTFPKSGRGNYVFEIHACLVNVTKQPTRMSIFIRGILMLL